MGMKTAMHELIEKLEELRDLHPADGKLNDRIQRGKYVFAIIEAKKLLEKEKQQIIDANRAGVDMVCDKDNFITGEEYYQSTFK